MGTMLIFIDRPEVTDIVNCNRLTDFCCSEDVPGNSSGDTTVPETDTGGQVEYTKALERTMLKELGKLLA